MKRNICLLFALSLVLSCKVQREGEVLGEIRAEHEKLWEILPAEAVVERIGLGFNFIEGPAWHQDGYLLFTDIPESTIYRWEGRRFGSFRTPSNNSNGLLAMGDGSLLCCEHGSRCLTRYFPDGRLDTLASHFRGKRFNSPNDLCRDGRGAIFFTDPPWGLSGRHNDPAKELPYAGVYRLYQGEVTLLDSTLLWPNGIALSPDDRTLYVANYRYGDPRGRGEGEAEWLQYDLDPAGRASNRRVLFRTTAPASPGGPDGMVVDRKGNIYATCEDGVLILDPAGRHLGTIILPDVPANVTLGRREKTLFITARSNLYKVEL